MLFALRFRSRLIAEHFTFTITILRHIQYNALINVVLYPRALNISYSPTASHALNGSAQICQCPIIPCSSNPLDLYTHVSSHAFPVFSLVKLPLLTTLTMPTSASTINPESAGGNASSASDMSSIDVKMLKYDSQPSLPVYMLARKGRRDCDHDGPCSVMGGEVGDVRD